MSDVVLTVGDKAPDFTLPVAGGGTVTLSEELSKHAKGVVVYFYPKASTPGCTTQVCDFTDSFAGFTAAGYGVIGISPDSVAAQERFATKNSVPFLLACDEDKSVSIAWGVWGEKNNYGRILLGIRRSTFVVAPDGTLTKAAYNVKATGHVARLRKELEI
ncbi:MAG: peroxiredoxin [Buchananella hordeovulneris]|nr:peroxiredoxin [Buchananella hordeovulneris]